MSNACPESFETDNEAAVSAVSLNTDGDPARPRWGEQRHECHPANKYK